MFIYTLYLSAGTQPISTNLMNVYSMFNTEKSIHIFQWESTCTCPEDVKYTLKIQGGNTTYSRDIPLGTMTSYYEKPLQEDTYALIVGENECSVQNTSNSIHFPAENCKWIHIFVAYDSYM